MQVRRRQSILYPWAPKWFFFEIIYLESYKVIPKKELLVSMGLLPRHAIRVRASF